MSDRLGPASVHDGDVARSITAADVIRILHELNEVGTTIVLITHDSDVAVQARRQVHVRDGLLLQ